MIGILFSDTSYKRSVIFNILIFYHAVTDINALDPVSDWGEGSLAGHVVQQHHAIRSPEVGLRHTSEPEQMAEMKKIRK